MAKDTFHDVVRNALQKEGWIITDDPLFIRWGGVEIYIDLGVEKLITAQKGTEKIAVEIKSFLRSSTISDFHMAIGQFMNYRLALEEKEPERMLVLAIPKDTYNTFFQLPFYQTAINRYQLRLMVYDIEKEVIVKWLI